MVTIDNVFKYEIDPSICANELKTLKYLASGLFQLYVNVTAIENPLRDNDKKNDKITFSYGNFPEMPQNTSQILPCFFHWYGTSLVNYARLVGFLSGLSSSKFNRSDLNDFKKFKIITKSCDDYVGSVPELAAVKIWRDKVAAHFAITAPRRTTHMLDNPAFLDFSVIYPVAYYDGRFRVGSLRIVRQDKEGNTHTGELPSWSLTETYEILRRRFWNYSI